MKCAPAYKNYTLEVDKTKEIFDFLLIEGRVKLPERHVILTREEIKGKEYCKYHNSKNHKTKGCWAL